MRSSLLFALVYALLSSLPTQAQTHPAPLITDNSAWLDSVQHLSLSQQVAAVQMRAWRDTLLAPPQLAVCWMGVSAATRSAAVAAGRPTPTKPSGFPLVYIVDGQTFDNHDVATIRQLQHVLQSQPLKQVTLLHDATATAIYGTRGANGVVVVSSTKAKHRH